MIMQRKLLFYSFRRDSTPSITTSSMFRGFQVISKKHQLFLYGVFSDFITEYTSHTNINHNYSSVGNGT